ncbi:MULTISPECIES: DUF5334 family protein [Microvirga]|uniref:DUF5334 family protein n=1 Tax=Microvirga TaxID=186650 RepID=UPI0013B431E7|nr:DUF5334 family protein [Microvirga sp. HBU67558]
MIRTHRNRNREPCPSGNHIEVYHSERGYGTYSVESIQRHGSTVKLEVYDYQTGEYQTFEMED